MSDAEGGDHTRLESRIAEYWNVQPPFSAEHGAPGTLRWSRSIAEHRYRVIPYLREWARFEAYGGKRVLEIGCGAGTDFCEFARGGAYVTGVDITTAAIDLTSRRLDAEGLTGRVIRYDGRRLPFEAASFDLVYAFGVLHHTPFMDDLLADIYRVLAPGGELKMMVYHRHSLLYYFSILYLRQWRQEQGAISREDALSRYSEFRNGCPYTRVLSPAEVKARLWFFDRVEPTVDYCVHDDLNARKLPGDRTFDVETTGIIDVDRFFDEFNDTVRTGADLRRYGWHLLVRAERGVEGPTIR